MFAEFLKLAIPVAIVGVIGACCSHGAEMLIPLAVVGSVIYTLFHAAKGFEPRIDAVIGGIDRRPPALKKRLQR